MWRQYRNEDWDRRKEYLIRSLFQDIPLSRLSPVPEEQESRGDSWSSRNILLSRPCSPLPPLIIEKYPNRHDDPPEFYIELERKMRQVYRKMFCNEGSSSIEDLLELYTNHDDDNSIFTDRHELVTSSPSSELNSRTKSLSKNTFETTQSPLHNITSNESVTTLLESSLQMNKEHRFSPNKTSEESTSSTPGFCGETQDTTQVVIHKTPIDVEDTEITNLVKEDAVTCNSPILELKFQTRYTLKEKQKSNDCSGEKFRNHKDSESSKKTTESEDGSIESSFEREDIEIMRRQERISLSLGSIQNNANDTETSSIATNVEFKRKASLEMYEDEDALYKEAGDVHNLTFLKDIHNEWQDTLSNGSSTKHFKSRSSIYNPVFNDTLNQHSPNMLIKKRRGENKSVQTSEENKRICWNDMKKIFFVGVPTIYKLCSCDDHVCKNQSLQ